MATINALHRPTSRRGFLKMGGAALAAAMFSGSLAACSDGAGSGSSPSAGTTLGMLNYADWIGASELADFEDQTGIVVEQYATPDGGDSAWVNKISQGDGVYDLSLAGIKVADALSTNGLLAEFDARKVPNLSNIAQRYIDAYPYGIPVEQGKVGFIYNKDSLATPPTSWRELFDNAAEYSGRLILPNFDSDVIDCGLMALGIDINTESTDDIEAAKDEVIRIKSHIKAFLDSGGAAAVADGSAQIYVGYDYEYAATAPDAPNIGWIAPEEGMFGYLDGWVPLAASEHLDEVYEFMNFHLDTDNYIDFINTTGASWLMEGIADQLDESIGTCEALDPDGGEVVYQQAVDSSVTQAISAAFQEIQSA